MVAVESTIKGLDSKCEGVSHVLISPVEGHPPSAGGGAEWSTAVPWPLLIGATRLGLRGIGARLSGTKWGDGVGHSHLGFDGRGEAAARAHNDGLLPCSKNSNEGGAPVILWPRRGAWQLQRTLAVLLIQPAALG
jgi:hypothetical protein